MPMTNNRRALRQAKDAAARSLFLRLLAGLLVAVLVGCVQPPLQTDRPPAKNVILFIGDGMGVSTVTAARIFDGQSKGLSGEEHSLVFETFPNLALVKTYNTNQQVPDSAGTATAMMTGSKTRAGVINVAAHVRRRDCSQALLNPLRTLSEMAKQRGRSVGIATTTRVTHATPATVYAHTPERDWENSRYVPSAAWAAGCRDIAHQLANLDPDVAPDVVLGGGHREFVGSALGGKRVSANEDLISQWAGRGKNRTVATTKDELVATQPGQQLLGLFAKSHMTYVAERTAQTEEPTLSEMTEKAIELLDGPDGYFLMVEGGRIDHGHHESQAGYALLETQAFAQAVEIALRNVDLKETLVLVTADHSHVFSMGGYPTRGNPILGLVVGNDKNGEPNPAPSTDINGTPYTTLGYANGPGAVTQATRATPETDIDAVYQSLVRMQWQAIDGSIHHAETHAGEDVALYAIGAGAENVVGVIEQNEVFNIMTTALGW